MRTRLATVLVALAANQVALPVAAAMSHVGTSPLYPAAAEPGVPSAVIETGQATIAGQLVELGRAPDVARAAASRLTAEDLEVFLANPEMMQAAGGNIVWGVMLGALVVGGVIALAAAGNGTLMLN